jgi:hypothetical protein
LPVVVLLVGQPRGRPEVKARARAIKTRFTMAAVWAEWPRATTVTGIPPGALLCLYTDGLVERRDQPLDAGIGQLADVLGQFAGPATTPRLPGRRLTRRAQR